MRIATFTESGRTRLGLVHGIFGAPIFFTCGELFWGHDRMDDAIAWCKNG